MRPLVLLSASFLGGALAARLLMEPGDGGTWPAAAGLVTLAMGTAAVLAGSRATPERGEAVSRDARRRWDPRARWRVGWPVALAVAAALAGGGMAAPGPPPPPTPAGPCRLEARVLESRAGTRPGCTLEVLHGTRIEDGATLPRGVRVRVAGAALPRGARLRTVLTLRPVARYRNPIPHPVWPDSRAATATAGRPPGGATLLSRDPIADALEAARAAVRQALSRSLEPRAAGLARALVLGEGHAVDEGARDAVRGAGLAHVLAVSGLHVTIVAGLFALVTRASMLRWSALASRVEVARIAWVMGAGMALAFAAFAGGAPSAWRAATTAALAWGLRAAGRRPRALDVAALAALLLGALSPAEVARPAFLLSVLATAAVLTTAPPSARTLGAWARAAFALAARTTVATAPLVLWCFGRVPAAGLLANVLLVPLASWALVPLAAAHALVALLLPPLASLTGRLFELSAGAFVAACDGFASLLPSDPLPPPSVPQGVAIAVGCGALLILRSWRHRAAAVALAMLAVAGGEVALRAAEKPEGILRVTFLDVGQGDAALVDLPDGHALLVDGGGTRSEAADPGRRVLLPLLSARRRSTLDAVVLTHPHPDHYGGLRAVLSAVPVTELWDSGQGRLEAPDGDAARLVAAARLRGTRVLEPEDLCGGDRHFGSATLRLLWPCPRYDAGHDPNDNSLVLRLRMGRHSFLLAGDVEAAAERSLLASGAPLRADVLKVPHHGSRTSSSAAFLDAVRPRVAVVSAGPQNRHGHPHPEVLARLRSIGARIHRIDDVGALVLTTDGAALSGRSWAGGALPPL